MKLKTNLLALGLAACASLGTAYATVTPLAWYHFGEGGAAITTDSTTNTNNFNSTYFASGVPPLVGLPAAGGPLGVSGYVSTNAAHFGIGGKVSLLTGSGTLNTTTGSYFVPPGTNYGIEAWFLPQNLGYVSDGSQQAYTPIFASGGSLYGGGPGGGATVLVVDNFDGTSSLQAAVIHQGNSAGAYSYFGPNILIDTNHWIHLALVNNNSTLIFYTNGVPCATNDNSANPLTAPGGTMYVGRDGGHVSIDGYLDELRVFSFNPGAFVLNDLLFAPNPRLVAQPQNTTVWSNGAANFIATVSPDPANTFQWYGGAGALAGQTASSLNIGTVSSTSPGNPYYCALTNGGVGLLTSNSVLTIVSAPAANVNAYRTAVNGESSLVAYFPGDGSTGSTLANTKDSSHNGALLSGAVYDGQTNRSFGERAIFLKGAGDVQIPYNSAYEFASGNGTVEALVYLTISGGTAPETIFSVGNSSGSGIHYALSASPDGATLLYTNDAGTSLSWSAPSNLLNRLAHVALVFSSTTNVTPYLDGSSLGTQPQPVFGAATGNPAWIGSIGSVGSWNGTIDEVAIYSSALPASTIAVHNSRFQLGTNTAPPVIVSQSPSKTILAGGSPSLSVAVSGTPPLAYQWSSNNVAISGATNSTLVIAHATASASASYRVVVTNPFGSTNNNANPIVLTVITPPAGGYAATVMTDSPVSYWRLADSSGQAAKDSAGFNDGAYSSTGVTYGAGGPPGDTAAAALFDGSSGRAVVPYSSSLNPSGPFTIEFWAQINNLAFCSPISSMVRPARSAGYEFYLYGNYNGYEFHTAVGGGYNMITGNNVSPNVGTWYHIAGVWNGTNITIYQDGYPVGTSSNPPFTANGSTPFYIGSRSDGNGYLNGSMSDVAFYNYALTPTQLQKHVIVGLPLKVAITGNTNIVADSKPVGPAYNGFNNGAIWQASDSDGTTTRTGVMNFIATNSLSQVYAPAYPELVGFTNGTITMWMHAGTYAGSSGAFQGATYAPTLQWRDGNGGCGFYIHNDGTLFVQSMNNYCHFGSVASVGDNKWHHVAFTFDQTALGGITCYIDGAQDSSGFNSQAWVWSSTALIELGEDFNDGYWDNYNGKLDDVRIYNRMLTQSEIAQAMGGAVVDTNALKMRLDFQAPPGGLQVAWPYGSLQSAPAVTGPYTTISTNVTSPYPVAPGLAPQYFYRGQQ